LKRAIERHLVYPLANLLATEQVKLGDVLCIDWDKSADSLIFEREGEGAVIPTTLTLTPSGVGAAASAHGGHAEEAPAAAAIAREAKAPTTAHGVHAPLPTSRRRSDTER
jgi:hypothetical protein